MNATATMTQKGQVLIPKSIRDYFGIHPFDRLSISVEDDESCPKCCV